MGGEEDLADPVRQLMRNVSDIKKEDIELLRLLSVNDIAVIHTQLSHGEISPLALWQQVKSAMLKRKTKIDDLVLHLTAQQTAAEGDKKELEAEHSAFLKKSAMELRSALEVIERNERTLQRNKDDYATEEFQHLLSEVQREKDELHQASGNQKEAAERAFAVSSQKLDATISDAQSQLQDLTQQNMCQRDVWETNAPSLVGPKCSGSQEVTIEYPAGYTSSPLSTPTKSSTVEFTPKCENCGAKFQKPPVDWLCPTCLAKKRHQKVWQLNSSAIRCTICHEVPIARFARHHCRSCGRVVCSRCCSNRALLTDIGYKGPEKVCDECYAKCSEAQRVELP